MNLLPVYKLWDIDLVRGEGCFVFDSDDHQYLDLYGGHAVISVGHQHPVYISSLTGQLHQLAYYSNSVRLPIQHRLARKLGKASRCDDYQLFLCNSGAEANENALKIASFHTGRKLVVAFEGGFHGRTHGALAVTDNPALRAEINQAEHVITLPWEDEAAVKHLFMEHGNEIAAVIIEPVQGVEGIRVASASWLQLIQRVCLQHGAMLIADEVQSGFGRTGRFFAHQHADISPHLITMAKGMGNGYPVGGVLIHGDVKAWPGMLGTTFGGHPLACAATLSVLKILRDEKLMRNATRSGRVLAALLEPLSGVKEVRGTGLMVGIEFDFPVSDLRDQLAYEYRILTGSARRRNTLRLLPPLNIKRKHLQRFVDALTECLEQRKAAVS